MSQPPEGRRTAAITAPLNVLSARADRETTLTIVDFEPLGVRRVSVGGGLALAAMGFARGALAGRVWGAFGFGLGAPTDAEMNRLTAHPAAAESPSLRA